jgi:hypothetical protein
MTATPMTAAEFCCAREFLGLSPQWVAAKIGVQYREAGGRPLRDLDYFKKFAAYMILVAVSALQRNMTEAERQAQAPLLQPCWQLVES